MTDSHELMEQLSERIAELPNGYISEKNINGKVQYYRQWREEGRLRSKYVRAEDLDSVRKLISERKSLEEKLKHLRELYPAETDFGYETNVTRGDDLRIMTESVKGLERRDIYPQIERYIRGKDRTHVLALYGLRRTGKTTMFWQTIAGMPPEDFEKTAYMKLQSSDTMAMVNRDLKRLRKAGYQYVFIDEVTLMEDFIDSAALFSDIFAPLGMKIVLSGTDSLGFRFAEDNELYDRVHLLHTTFIPYREYVRLLGIDSIDEYIRYGGTFRMGETDFDDEDLNAEDASFQSDESTRRYIDTAICRNIQHSLACFRDGRMFSHLYALYEAGELTNAINRIIEDMNHRFVLSVLTKDFKSHDLGISAANLRKERDSEKRTDILDIVDRSAITGRLMKILDIRNRDQLTVPLTSSHVLQIREYLKTLDLILSCPVEHCDDRMEGEEQVLFSQPGMRYSQAQALVHSLMKDEIFRQLSARERNYVAERILEEVRGRMLEDMVLLETLKSLGKRYQVFKLRCHMGEFDMVIYDSENDCCAVYEIKHSGECVPEQAKHLRNPEMIASVSHRYGTLVGRYVLYLGKPIDTEDGISYRNAAEFLRTLPEFRLDNGKHV